MNKAKLILQDGTIFEGTAFGAPISVSGEVVFATGMVGYDQSLTDPSYKGQILTFTYPLVGNWGVPPKDFWESEKVHVSGLIISDLTEKPSHWQSTQTLDSWLKQQNVPGIWGIDTRRLTQKLRDHGVMLGKIVVGRKDARLPATAAPPDFELTKSSRAGAGNVGQVKIEDPNLRNLVAEVSINKVKIHYPTSVGDRRGGPPSSARSERFELTHPINNHQARTSDGGRAWQDPHALNIGLLNCGAKKNIIRCLTRRGVTVFELPWNFNPFETNLKDPERSRRVKLDGLMISNGPGNPKMAKETIATIKKSMDEKLPTFGICLGNQLLALAAGGDTYKLKFGHRAQNQPTIEVKSGRCYITTQNHGFAVDEKKMPAGFTRWFYNANDNTNEGIIHKTLPFFSVQFHPEAAPGPTDTEWLFDYFLNVVSKNKPSYFLERIRHG
ncbi:MAG: glutamine-hydrolyzing carbamoyl-phosphate synthase small subunit [Candidatus Curtissbacteria bacterium]|nr:glutamine-hydrolyzing carbamoyl-phosphate synthase small subunit [Candidatus Curtissbacteria bacterium]